MRAGKSRIWQLVLVAVASAAVALSAGASGAVPSAHGTITGCYDLDASDTKKGTLRVIDAEAGQACTTKEGTLSWRNGSDADTLDGLDSEEFVHIVGRVLLGGQPGGDSPFTSERTETGEYFVRFPAGTFEGCRLLTPVITPFSPGKPVIAVIAGISCTGDGGAVIAVRTTDSGGTPTDSAFTIFVV